MNNSLHQKALLCVRNYKKSESELVSVLSEIDRGKSYLTSGANSLFSYCVSQLGLGESETCRLIQVSRKSIEIPALKYALDTGVLTVSKAARITSVITQETQEDWIHKAATLTHREIEKEIVRVSPHVLKSERLIAKTPEISELRLNISKSLEQKLNRAREVFRTASLEETLEKITDMALKHKDPLEKAKRRLRHKDAIEKGKRQLPDKDAIENEKRQLAQKDAIEMPERQLTHRPRGWCISTPLRNSQRRAGNSSRYIQASLKHQVTLRDKSRCQYKNCSSAFFTEIHHIKPISLGGNHELSNLITLCSPHHAMLHHFQKSRVKYWKDVPGITKNVPSKIN